MTESIIALSREFFFDIVKPILERRFPEETPQAAIGVFGYGSEALGLDDQYSSDHHFGLRIDMVLPDQICQAKCQEIVRVVSEYLPPAYRGHSLREGHVSGAGLAPESLQHYLRRTIGMDHIPQSYQDWLTIPDEEVIHITNGEVWYDPTGRFTAIREAFANHYPEPVRLRRIAHWCRYFSGMGSYALKRAILRDNEYYAATAFGKAIRWGVQLAFMLDRQYFPYDKWIMAFFERLPRLAEPLLPVVNEAVSLSTPWERKLALLNEMADILDGTMVADGIIEPHPKFTGSASSGYRLLEHAYAEIIQKLPEEIKTIVPVWDQIYLEQFHSGYVDSLDLEIWDELLNLTPVDEQAE